MKTFNDYINEAIPNDPQPNGIPPQNKLPNRMPTPPPVPPTNKKVMSGADLARALFSPGSVPQVVYDSNGRPHVGSIMNIQREDGGGKSFNITLVAQNGQKETFHLRIA